MEDQRRDMDSLKEEVTEARGSSLSPGELTIMVIRSVGKIRSFKISRKVILWTSLFLLAYILVSVYVFNRFFELRYLNNIQSEKLESLEKALDQNERSLFQARQYMAGLEDYIKNYDSRKEEEVSAPIETDESIKTVDTTTRNPITKSDGQEESATIVDIEDIAIQIEDSGMTVDFKLVNARSEESAAEGYIHIIARDKKKDYPEEWNYAYDKLKNGIPVNFRRGQPFLIQRFKTYHRQFNINSNSEFPAAIKVLVYNPSGDLILNRELETANES